MTIVLLDKYLAPNKKHCLNITNKKFVFLSPTSITQIHWFISSVGITVPVMPNTFYIHYGGKKCNVSTSFW